MKKTRSNWPAALLCSAWIPVACSGGGNVNIGNTQAVGGNLSDYAASWDGYAEAFTFPPSGSSDRVRLNIDANGQGTLQVGDGALLPPATDPTVAYPPGAVPDNSFLLNEGFAYPIYAAQIQENRIQLGINPYDLFSVWCSLQTSFPFRGTIADGGPVGPDAGNAGTSTFYNCVQHWPDTSAASGDGGSLVCSLVNPNGPNEVIDCSKLLLCGEWQVCQCAATGCVQTPVPAGTTAPEFHTELDAALDSTGSSLVGTLVIALGNRVTVRMQRK
jgi:hypothetical protein